MVEWEFVPQNKTQSKLRAMLDDTGQSGQRMRDRHLNFKLIGDKKIFDRKKNWKWLEIGTRAKLEIANVTMDDQGPLALKTYEFLKFYRFYRLKLNQQRF